jgi:endonuclease/exonuclease/phosphatase family metal-dependent hydrolase
VLSSTQAPKNASQIRALAWNLYHGRDFPPDPGLLTWRSRLLRLSERNETHLQVNRDLLPEFAGLLAGAEWDIALLQECPPRWLEDLARQCGAQAHASLTSRNSCPRLRAALARLNPDLIASNEGGSNTTLVRGERIVERGEIQLRPRPTLRLQSERRTMALVRLESGPCVGNLHASNLAPALAEEEVRLAARRAIDWSRDAPLILGGDFNLRAGTSAVFAELEREYGLRPATPHPALDHLLARGLEAIEPPRAWPADRREQSEGGRAIRLSDHAPVVAVFGPDGARAREATHP